MTTIACFLLLALKLLNIIIRLQYDFLPCLTKELSIKVGYNLRFSLIAQVFFIESIRLY